jgi:mannitol operon transcriptional antiterminator
MTRHISRTLLRLKLGLPIDNPFTNDIKHENPEMWQAVTDAINSLDSEYGEFSQDEVAYLTMYILLAQQLDKKPIQHKPTRVFVVCPTGGVSIWMLVSRLKTEFPDIQIVNSVSLRNLFQQDFKQVDAIITTARDIDVKDLPVVSVTPMLSEKDIEKINQLFI